MNNAALLIELETDFSDYDPGPEPTIDATDADVLATDERFYTAALRRPGDVVLSGPVAGGWGPGRYFQSKRTALRYMMMKFGQERVKFLAGSTRGRWAFLIKNLRKDVLNEA